MKNNKGVRYVFHLAGDITSNALSQWLFNKLYLEAKSGDSLVIVINSAGGDVLAGLEAASLIERSHLHVTTIITGAAESAAFLVAISGHTRLMLEEAHSMAHVLSASVEGTFHGLKGTVQSFEFIHDRMVNLIGRKIHKKYKKYVERHILSTEDKWFLAPDMLEYGLIDRIVKLNDNILKELEHGNT